MAEKAAARDPRMNTAYGVPVERLNDGKPIIAPSERWWETGVTFNPAAIYLPRTPENEAVIRALLPMRASDDADLRDGVVAVHYRARPEHDPGAPSERSFIGLALFTPQLKPLYRYLEPVLLPGQDPTGYDALGVEDPRVSRIDGRFYMVYCGVQPDVETAWRARLCLAVSDDLLRWTKLGPMTGDVDRWNNKDGVFFPDKIDGQYYLLHRPFEHDWPKADYAIRLAVSGDLRGPWRDLGPVLRAFRNPRMLSSWVGAGTEPYLLDRSAGGAPRYLHIYHTGSYLSETDREYDTAAALFDFNRFDPADPSALITNRIEPLMVPETPAELHSRSRLQVGNVLFACGSYAYQGWLYLVYGGADTYTLAARVKIQTLVAALEGAGLRNPYEG